MKPISHIEIYSETIAESELSFLSGCKQMRMLIYEIQRNRAANKTRLATALNVSRPTLYKLMDNFELLTLDQCCTIIDFCKANNIHFSRSMKYSNLNRFL